MPQEKPSLWHIEYMGQRQGITEKRKDGKYVSPFWENFSLKNEKNS